MQIEHYKIEQYIQNELTGNELLEFEELLEKDEELRKKVNFYQYSMSVLSENKPSTKSDEEKIAQINPILEEFRDQYFINKTTKTKITKEESKPKSRVVKLLLPFAALAAAAALLIFFLLPQLQSQSNSQIAEDNFKIYPLGNQMGEFEETIKNYTIGNFEEADKQLSNRLKELPDSPDLWLAKGCTKFELDEINEAIYSFEKVIEIDDSGISRPYAHWYLALSYLKKDDPEKAIHHLNKIKEGADNYSDVKRLLRQLK